MLVTSLRIEFDRQTIRWRRVSILLISEMLYINSPFSCGVVGGKRKGWTIRSSPQYDRRMCEYVCVCDDWLFEKWRSHNCQTIVALDFWRQVFEYWRQPKWCPRATWINLGTVPAWARAHPWWWNNSVPIHPTESENARFQFSWYKTPMTCLLRKSRGHYSQQYGLSLLIE